MQPKIRVKRTPNGWHPYTATMTGKAPYGWGHTPAEAKAKLLANLQSAEIESAAYRASKQGSEVEK
jgi:hypothetical protein